MSEIKIQVKLFGHLVRFYPQARENQGQATLNLPEKSTVQDMIQHLEIPDDMVEVVFVNEEKVSKDQVLKDGDEVGMLPLIAGG